MKLQINDQSQYQITFEWLREKRTVTTGWLSAQDTKNLIDLCNANPIKIHVIEEWAA